MKKCPNCKIHYKTYRKNQIYCSRKCWKEDRTLTSEEHFFREKLTRLKTNAKKRNIPIDLKWRDLKDQNDSQNGNCYYTNIPMNRSFTKGSKMCNPLQLSVDRVDSSMGYTKNNIVLCCFCINNFKGTMDIKELENVFSIIQNNFSCSEAKIKILEGGEIPLNSNALDVGYDLKARKVEEFEDYIKVYSGISVSPPKGFHIELFPRSSVYKKGLYMANGIGLIDPNYTGEIIGIFYKKNNYKLFNIGERFAQLVFRKTVKVKFVEVSELSDTDRGIGGFGSTGV